MATNLSVEGGHALDFPPENTIFLNDIEAARLLRISKSFLRKLVKQGELPAPIKLGRRALWSRSSLHTAMARLEVLR